MAFSCLKRTITCNAFSLCHLLLVAWVLCAATGNQSFAQNISTVAGTGDPGTTAYGFSGDGGLATSAQLFYPMGAALDASGNLYIADYGNHRIRMVTATTGVISTVAGTGVPGSSGDGGLAISAQLQNPAGIAVDANGNLYIADAGNHRIRKVTATTGIISTVAGTGIAGSRVSPYLVGDGGLATSAQLYNPKGVALDASGNLYIADRDNHRIRKVTASTGIISTVAGAGSPGFYDGAGGLATSAALNGPEGVALDAAGNLYISDYWNHRIRRVTASTGIISTVAGTGIQGFSGDGGPATSARLNQPRGIAVDASGNLYIAEIRNHRIRKVTASTGIISTVAGTGIQGFSGDGGLATSAQFEEPAAVVVDASGDLYIADSGNHRIRKVTTSTPTPALQIAGKIAFSSSRDSNYEIYTTNPDGSELTRVTNQPGDDQQSAWSPDGTEFAFVSNRTGDWEVYKMRVDGSGPIRLTNSAQLDEYPVWSPDGSKIAFTSHRTGNLEIWVMNADGTNQVNLTNNPAYDGYPHWSPDGTRIVFSSDRAGNQDLYLMNADGTGTTQLTNDGVFCEYPAWSPDGMRIAYNTLNDGSNEIYVINADGSGKTQLTFDPGIDRMPRWSPDGTRIVFYSSRDGSQTANETYVMDARGGGVFRLTNNAADDLFAYWDSPCRIGSTTVGTPVSRVIKIKNAGGALLTVSAIVSDNANFSANPASFSVAPGDSQGVTVSCLPMVKGTQYATLTISSNDASSPTAKLTVNGTGQGIVLTVPDTVASYSQLVSVPVRVSDTSGEGVVAGEVDIAFDGDLLTMFSVGTSSTLMSGWTVQRNVVQGNSTVMDTLKIAAAHTTALSGAGALFNVRFQVGNVRHPATSPLTLSHVLFNTGSVETTIDNGSVKVIGYDGIITRDKAQVIPRESIWVQVIDPDEDLDSTGVDDLDVTVTVRDSVEVIQETEVLKLFETGIHSGSFTGSMGTVFSLVPDQGDFALQVRAGQHLEFLHDDLLDGSGNGPLNRRVTTQVIGGKDGRLRLTAVSQPGDTVRVRVVDGDLNIDPGVQESRHVAMRNRRTGEVEVVTLVERSASDSVFFGQVPTNLGSSGGANNDGVLNTRKADSLVVNYTDSLTSAGAIVEVQDRDQVVNPFGDADGNGSVQAYDAARVLFHVLAPFLVGIDSLSANVDSLAPFGPITPYDASLILQKRVGLIGRFPVQEDESDNHPQPETDLSTPKPVVAQRVLSLLPGEGYWSVMADERGGILSGEVVLSGIEGKVELGPELQEYLVASRSGEGGVRVVFAGAVPVSGPGELLRVYPGVGPGRVQLTRAELNDGQLGVVLSGVAAAAELPTSYALLANYPNPFNPETTIGFALPERSIVILAVYDVLGQRVRVLVGRELPAGQHQVVWDGRDELGRSVSSGVYMYRLQAGAFSQLKRMVMIK